MKIDLRKATTSNIADVCKMHQQSWFEAFGSDCMYPESALDKWNNELQKADSLTFIAFFDDGIAGYLHLTATGECPEISDLYVIPAARRRGVASLLLEEVLCQFPNLTLWVSESNAPAIALYGSKGFQPTGKGKKDPRARRNDKKIELIFSK